MNTFLHFFRILERTRSAEGKAQSQSDKIGQHFRGRGITMHEPALLQKPLSLLQKFERFLRRVAAVNDDGEPELVRELQLTVEKLPLQFGRRVVVEVLIQTDLPDRYAFFVVAQRADFVQIPFAVFFQFARVKARAKIDVIVMFGELFRTLGRGEVETRAYDEPDSVFLRPFQRFLHAADFLKFVPRQMTMYVDIHSGSPY